MDIIDTIINKYTLFIIAFLSLFPCNNKSSICPIINGIQKWNVAWTPFASIPKKYKGKVFLNSSFKIGLYDLNSFFILSISV